MNVFDFDKTIIKKDSVVCFTTFELLKHKKLLKYLPSICWGGILFGLKLIDRTHLKRYVYAYFKDIDDLDAEIKDFWDTHMYLVNDWYLNIKNEDDIVISGTADFLVNECMFRLGINNVIGSKVDKKTGIPISKNCTGEEKVRRFNEAGYASCDKFYSDSLMDLPMASLAKEAYLVKGEKVSKWII